MNGLKKLFKKKTASYFVESLSKEFQSLNRLVPQSALPASHTWTFPLKESYRVIRSDPNYLLTRTPFSDGSAEAHHKTPRRWIFQRRDQQIRELDLQLAKNLSETHLGKWMHLSATCLPFPCKLTPVEGAPNNFTCLLTRSYTSVTSRQNELL